MSAGIPEQGSKLVWKTKQTAIKLQQNNILFKKISYKVPNYKKMI